MPDILQQLSYPKHTHLADAPALVVRDLTVRYGDFLALDHVTFEMQRVERVAVVGPNGAGKSTLFKAISGINKPTSGEISIFGQPPGGHICIAYVPQRSQIDWSFPVTVADVVMMGRSGKIGLFRWPSKKDWEIVYDALEQVSMRELSTRQIGELSGGQQQRVFLARALAQEAELLLLDEPFTGLDAPSQQAILHILDIVRARGVTALVSTHDLDLAARNFDKMMLLNRRVIAYGPPDQVFVTEKLIEAYGGHIHTLSFETETPEELVLADTCCEGPDEHRWKK
jgi:manganese/iron transport system ATP-binding protein